MAELTGRQKSRKKYQQARKTVQITVPQYTRWKRILQHRRYCQNKTTNGSISPIPAFSDMLALMEAQLELPIPPQGQHVLQTTSSTIAQDTEESQTPSSLIHQPTSPPSSPQAPPSSPPISPPSSPPPVDQIASIVANNSLAGEIAEFVERVFQSLICYKRKDLDGKSLILEALIYLREKRNMVPVKKICNKTGEYSYYKLSNLIKKTGKFSEDDTEEILKSGAFLTGLLFVVFSKRRENVFVSFLGHKKNSSNCVALFKKNDYFYYCLPKGEQPNTDYFRVSCCTTRLIDELQK